MNGRTVQAAMEVLTEIAENTRRGADALERLEAKTESRADLDVPAMMKKAFEEIGKIIPGFPEAMAQVPGGFDGLAAAGLSNGHPQNKIATTTGRG